MNDNLLQTSQRVTGYDIIRSMAIFFVIAGHFIAINTPFYTEEFKGISMCLKSAILPIFSTGVPLFLILTGFLNTHKNLSIQYYKGIRRVIESYLFFSIITIFFRALYLKETMPAYKWITGILDFTMIPYAWYIEMYIGLFLLIPFLNIIYKGLSSKKQKQVLLLTCFCLSSLPMLLNKRGFQIIPNYWLSIYPILYYFIGCYIYEYRPQIKSHFKAWAIIACFASIEPIVNILFNKGVYIYVARTIASPFCLVMATLLFTMYYAANIKYELIKSFITNTAKFSLDMYLCSYIIDKLIYPLFVTKYMVIIVPVVFFVSFGTATLKDLLFKLKQL
jgi:surface polysaccharide O-acyltransferase-like enzyme